MLKIQLRDGFIFRKPCFFLFLEYDRFSKQPLERLLALK